MPLSFEYLDTALLPAGAIAEVSPSGRYLGAFSTSLAALTTAQMSMTAIALPAGAVIASITFVSGTVALATGTNGWAALYDSSRALLRQSADAVPAWAANTAKTFTLTAPYTIPARGLYYLGLTVKATTVPTLRGWTADTILNGLMPIISGTSTGSLTATAPTTAAALTAVASVPYAYVS